MSVGIAVLGASVGIGAGLVLAGVTGREVLRPLRLASATHANRIGTSRVLSTIGAGTVVLAATRWPIGAVLAAGGAAAAPRLIGGKAAREAVIARTEAIATWTEMVRDSIVAAAGLGQAIGATEPVAPEAIRIEVRRLVARLEQMPLVAALLLFGDDLAHPCGDLVVAALTITASSEASNLSGLLTRLAVAIRGEAQMRIRVEVGRARVRTASKVILGVVAATIGLLAVLNRDYLAAYSTRGGQLMLLVVGSVFALGGWLLIHMAEIDLPERFSSRSSGAQR